MTGAALVAWASIAQIAAAQPVPAPAADYGKGDVCHQAAAPAGHRVKCLGYPGRFSYHKTNCRWIDDVSAGGDHQFEVCHDPDGAWRPSGRD
jgi:hypothetical protein